MPSTRRPIATPTDPASPGVLSGFRVVDCTELLPGAYATRLLAGLGAEVVKIERPGRGDALRARPDVFEAENAGKTSVAINLKHHEGLAALNRLLAGADVFIDGYRPGVLARLGLDSAALREANPGLIHVSLTGYGVCGPYARRPGHDLQFLALAGAIPEPSAAADGDVEPIAAPVADISGALVAVLGVVLALFRRTRATSPTQGEHLDVALADAAVAMMEPRFAGAAHRTSTQARPAYGIYRCADGKHVSIGAIEDHFFATLVEALEVADLRSPRLATYRQRVDNVEEVESALRARIALLAAGEVVARLQRADVPVERVGPMSDVLGDPHLRERRMVRESDEIAPWPVALGGYAAESRLGPAPRLGADTRRILGATGFPDTEIDRLAEAGIIAV